MHCTYTRTSASVAFMLNAYLLAHPCFRTAVHRAHGCSLSDGQISDRGATGLSEGLKSNTALSVL